MWVHPMCGSIKVFLLNSRRRIGYKNVIGIHRRREVVVVPSSRYRVTTLTSDLDIVLMDRSRDYQVIITLQMFFDYQFFDYQFFD